MRLSFCNKRICMYAFGPCGARPALHCMHCLQGRWFRPWSKLRNSSQSQLAFSVKLTAINSCRSTKTVTAFKRALKTELIAVAYGSHLGLAFLFTRLRFARDLRRFRNVFWLIDWLIHHVIATTVQVQLCVVCKWVYCYTVLLGYWCCFWTTTKTFLFSEYRTSVHSASEALATMCYINWCFTYLLTYFYPGLCPTRRRQLNQSRGDRSLRLLVPGSAEREGRCARMRITCDGSAAAVESLRRQPLDDEDGRTGSVHAEHEYQAPRRVVVRLCADDAHASNDSTLSSKF